jgi:hypothetical protein
MVTDTAGTNWQWYGISDRKEGNRRVSRGSNNTLGKLLSVNQI